MKKTAKDLWNGYLSIGFSDLECLVFSWNLKESQKKSQTNFHIFMFLNKQIDESVQLVQQYYRQMRSGDILGVLTVKKDQGDSYHMRWIEKMQIQSRAQNVFKKQSTQFLVPNFDLALSYVLGKTSNKKRCMCFINIIGTTGQQNSCAYTTNQFEKILTQKRKNQQLPQNHVFQIFCKQKSYSILNTESGVNIIPYEKRFPNFAVNCMKIYEKSLALAKIKVWFEVSCKQNIHCSTNQWNNTGFGVYEKSFFGITASKAIDKLYFLNLEGKKDFQSAIKINLEITHCNGEIESCETQLDLKLDSKKIMAQTFVMNSTTHKNIYLGHQEIGKTDFIDKDYFFFFKEF